MRLVLTIRQYSLSWSCRLNHVVAKSSNRILSFSTIENGAKFTNDSDDWSNTLSFACPESDFSSELHVVTCKQSSTLSSLSLEQKTVQGLQLSNISNESLNRNWSHRLSFASPESDFSTSSTNEWKVGRHVLNQNDLEESDIRDAKTYSNAFSTAAPNTDLVISDIMRGQLQQAEQYRLEKFDSAGAIQDQEFLSRPEKTFCMKDDLSHFDQVDKQDNLLNTAIFTSKEPIPTTLFEASKPDDNRAIVITEAANPFHIVSVNSVWESLCGYTEEECKGKTLSIIQGTETDQAAITSLLNKLLLGEKEVGTLVTNYKKSGDKFVNRLRVGPLVNHLNEVTHYVGILEDVSKRKNIHL